VCALCSIYRVCFARIRSTAHLTACFGFLRSSFLYSRAAFTAGLRFESVPNHASSSILGPPRHRLPSSLVIESASASTSPRLPAVLAEALPMNANDYRGSMSCPAFAVFRECCLRAGRQASWTSGAWGFRPKCQFIEPAHFWGPLHKPVGKRFRCAIQFCAIGKQRKQDQHPFVAQILV